MRRDTRASRAQWVGGDGETKKESGGNRELKGGAGQASRARSGIAQSNVRLEETEITSG